MSQTVSRCHTLLHTISHCLTLSHTVCMLTVNTSAVGHELCTQPIVSAHTTSHCPTLSHAVAHYLTLPHIVSHCLTLSHTVSHLFGRYAHCDHCHKCVREDYEHCFSCQACFPASKLNIVYIYALCFFCLWHALDLCAEYCVYIGSVFVFVCGMLWVCVLNIVYIGSVFLLSAACFGSVC